MLLRRIYKFWQVVEVIVRKASQQLNLLGSRNFGLYFLQILEADYERVTYFFGDDHLNFLVLAVNVFFQFVYTLHSPMIVGFEMQMRISS